MGSIRERTCHTLVVNGLVESESDGRAGGDGVGRGLGRVWLRAGVAADVVASHVGDGAVVVGVQADVLVVGGGDAVGDEFRPAVVGESGVRKRQQAERCCEVEMHGDAFLRW
jgi:hypothetical protein